MHIMDITAGDYVHHRDWPRIMWEVLSVDPYTATGGETLLRHIGGAVSPEARRQIFPVYMNSDVARIRDLEPANPMLVLAFASNRRG